MKKLKKYKMTCEFTESDFMPSNDMAATRENVGLMFTYDLISNLHMDNLKIEDNDSFSKFMKKSLQDKNNATIRIFEEMRKTLKIEVIEEEPVPQVKRSKVIRKKTRASRK